MKRTEDGGWSPYPGGAPADLGMILPVWFTGKYYDYSTTCTRGAGLIDEQNDESL